MQGNLSAPTDIDLDIADRREIQTTVASRSRLPDACRARAHRPAQELANVPGGRLPAPVSSLSNEKKLPQQLIARFVLGIEAHLAERIAAFIGADRPAAGDDL
jgi:hypothetical protein